MQSESQKIIVRNEKQIKDIDLSTTGDNFQAHLVQDKNKKLNRIEKQKPESISPNSQVKSYNTKLKI